MCTGGQDIPATIRVDGGVEDGQWKTSDTFNPSSSEETSIVESSEEATETMEPSAGLYQPVIDRINTLSERLPEKISKETTNEISPILNNLMGTTHRGFDRTQMGLRSLQRRLGQGGIRPRIDPPRPLGPRVMDSIKGGFGGKGFGSGRQMEKAQLTTPAINELRQQLMDPRRPPVTDVPSSITPTTSAQTTNPGDTFKFFNQPEFLKSTSSMQSYKNGGIIEALMMTPIGQNELKKLAVGGVVGGLDTLVSGGQQTGASLEDISLGKATFFEPFTYKTKAKDTLESIEETLGITPTKKKIIENQEQFGDHEDRDGPYSGKEIGGVGESPESYTGGMKGTGLDGLGSFLGNALSAGLTLTGVGGLLGKGVSVGNSLINQNSAFNKAKGYLTGDKVGSYIADTFSSPDTFSSLGSREYGPEGVVGDAEQNPVHVGMHESEFGGGYHGFVGPDGFDSVDTGGYDPGIDEAGQATGQELGEEDDAWGHG